MRRRRGCGCVTGLLVLVVIGVVYLGIHYATDVLFQAPWAYGIFGRSTLTGDWSGTLTTPHGTVYLMYLELNRSTSSRGAFLNSGRTGRAYVDGTVSWCARGVPNTGFRLDGTANRDASIVRLEVRSPAHPRPGPIPGTLNGAWHGSSLALQARFRRFNGHAYVYSSANPEDTRAVMVTLHKSSAGAYRATASRNGCPA